MYITQKKEVRPVLATSVGTICMNTDFLSSDLFFERLIYLRGTGVSRQLLAPVTIRRRSIDRMRMTDLSSFVSRPIARGLTVLMGQGFYGCVVLNKASGTIRNGSA